MDVSPMMQDRPLAILTPGQTEYDHESCPSRPDIYGNFFVISSQMRGGLLSGSGASMAHVHHLHPGYGIFAETSRFDDHENVRQIIHLRDTPNTLLNANTNG